MGFKKGNTHSNGRPKGSLNKVEGRTKAFIRKLIEDNEDKMLRELLKLEGKAFLESMKDFMEYIQPKLSRTEVEASVKTEEVNPFEDMSVEDLKAMKKIRDKYKD